MNDSQMPNGQTPSPSAIRPASTLGWALMLGGLAGFFLFRVGYWGLLAGVLGALMIFFAGGRSEPAAQSAEDESTEFDARLKALKRYVGKTRYLENVGDLGEQAAEQFAEITHRFSQFEELLALKFEPGELTYARYHGAAKQLFLGVLDNLQLIATGLNTVDAIDPRYLERRASASNGEEAKDLEERKRLREQQITGIKEMLADNEQAITEFDRVRAALAELQTRRGEADIALESAMEELKKLAERAKKYELNSGDGSGL